MSFVLFSLFFPICPYSPPTMYGWNTINNIVITYPILLLPLSSSSFSSSSSSSSSPSSCPYADVLGLSKEEGKPFSLPSGHPPLSSSSSSYSPEDCPHIKEEEEEKEKEEEQEEEKQKEWGKINEITIF